MYNLPYGASGLIDLALTKLWLCITDAVLQILLCQANSNHSHGMSLEELFKDKAVGLEGLGQMFETEVPLHQPLTRKQFQDASKLWPTTFHEDKQ